MVTYPPELLPTSEDEAEIVVDGIGYSPEEARTKFLEPLGCYDCGRPYEKGPDLVVSHEDWAKIAPNPPTGGVLCPNCMNDRFEALGMRNVKARFTSGPFACD